MTFRTVLMLAALAIAVPACVVYTKEPGAVSTDGSVYLGFNLFSMDGKTERENYPVGQQHGAFSAIRLHADDPTAIGRVAVVFADGERYEASGPLRLGAGQWSAPMSLPRGPRAIHSVVVIGRSMEKKKLANVEVYGIR